jgi:hypothetical protein
MAVEIAKKAFPNRPMALINGKIASKKSAVKYQSPSIVFYFCR